MGLISVITGLDTRRTTYTFTGKIRDNLRLNWDYTKIFRGGEEITPDYSAGEGDIILIQEYPGESTGNVFGDIALGILTGGVYSIVNSAVETAKARRQMDEALSRLNAKTNTKQTETIPFINNAKNIPAEGQAAPILLGRHSFAPYFLSNPYMKISGTDGERLDWYGTFLVAQKDLCFEKIRLGTKIIKSFSGNGITPSETYSFDPGHFYDQDNKIELRQDGLFSDSVFDQKWVDSLQSQIALDYPVTDDEQNGGKKWDDSKVIVRRSAKHPVVVEIELTFEGLFAWDSQNGVPADATAEVYIGWSADGENYRQIPITGFDGDRVPGIADAEGTGQDIPEHSKITRNKNKQMRFIARLDINDASAYRQAVFDRGEIDIKFMRCNPEGGGSTRDKVYVTAIRTQVYGSTSSASDLIPAKNLDARIRDKFCRIGIKIKADDRTKEGLDEFNVTASMTGRTWDGSGWSDDKTAVQNSAAVALEVLTGLIHDASGFTDDELDKPGFGAVYDFCENQQITLESGETKPVVLQANGYLTKTTKKIDILKQILSTCEGGLYINEFGKLILYTDRPQTIPVALLNPQRIVKMSVNRNLARKADGYKIEYINQDEDFAVDTFRILRKGKSGADPGALEYTYTPVQFYLVTQYLQAAWLARRMQAKEILRPAETKVTVGKEGRHYPVNSLIKVQHERFRIGIGSGEIAALIYDGGKLAGFRTLERFDLAADREYIAEYQVTTPVQNKVMKKQIAPSGEYTDILMFVTPEEPEGAGIPEMGNIVSVSLRAYESKLYLVGAGAAETADGFELPLIDYDPAIYDSGPVPDYRSRLIAEQPRVYDTFERDVYDGLPGREGRGVSGHAYKYRVTAGSVPPTQGWDDAGWSTVIPGMSAAGKYLWSIERMTYTDGAFQDTITLSAVYGDTGNGGVPATVYEILPGVTVIKRDHSGVTDPPEITCVQRSITGNNPPAPSNKKLVYVTSKDETETLYSDAVSIGEDWDWIEFRLYDGNTLLDRWKIPVLSDGPPATVYKLVPSVPMIVRNPSGAASPSAVTCGQQVITGNNPPAPSDKKLVYVTSSSPAETVYSGPVTVDWDWIEFRLYDGSRLLDQERIFVLSEGKPAEVYELLPGASVIRVYDGITEPFKISCSQVLVTGNSPPVSANKTLKYATSLDGEQPYTGEIPVNPRWAWIEFRLYDGDTLLDTERVPVLSDGDSPIYLDLANQNITVRADEYGDPYGLPIITQAILYNGNTPVTNADFKADVAARNIVRYPGNIFDPMLGDFYPVRFVQWSVSRGTVDQNGRITVSELPEDRAEIEVRAFYGDKEYTAALTLIKVKDGESPTVIDIENENTSIACDAYGVPYPNSLPLVTRAIFYKGTEKVNPFWFLSSPVRGIGIDSDGTITVSKDAELERVNNIQVLAMYRGKTYSRMFTVTKTLEGFTATVYELLPGANVIRRDAEGNCMPETIGCARQKIVGNNPPEPSDKKLVYVTSSSPAETVYSGPVAVDWDWIEFRLYDTNDVLLDMERIPVISNGADGVPGEPGEDGVTYYTWIRYADNAQGGGISDSPTGKKYIGLAYNKTTATESANAADYKWSLIKGTDGVPGAAGVTYYTWIKYADNAQGGGISDSPTGKNYIGFAYNKTTATESNNPADYSWSLIKGADGVPGEPGADGVTYYTWIKYADNADGTGLYDTPTDRTKYIGIAVNKTTATESNNKADYSWSLFKGADGVPGEPGADGVTYYTWIKYADSADGTGMYQQPKESTKYIGIAVNKTTATESNNKADYKWSLFKGEDAITVDIEDQEIFVNCDAYGVPYPGDLPATTNVKLYAGETPVSADWSLESPPAGISISGGGIITVAANAALANHNRIQVKAAYKGDTYTRIFTIVKVLDGESPMKLDIIPPVYQIPSDYLGNLMMSSPLTAKATLYKGEQEITAAKEISEAARVDIIHYPGNIFDPMLGGFYPTLGYPVTWTLVDAPEGVTIDRYGNITVSATARLKDMNSITVRALYHGKPPYEAVFVITKAKGGTPGSTGPAGPTGPGGKDGDAANVPKYRGATLVADTGNTG
ncbi:MAG: hypothetical protein LBH35_05105, partial [Treponema sp.]|nr:hypothetical protein [Treponema sp.]